MKKAKKESEPQKKAPAKKQSAFARLIAPKVNDELVVQVEKLTACLLQRMTPDARPALVADLADYGDDTAGLASRLRILRRSIP